MLSLRIFFVFSLIALFFVGAFTFSVYAQSMKNRTFMLFLHFAFVSLNINSELCSIKNYLNMTKLYFKRFLVLCSLACLVFSLQAQAPSGYYSAAKGKKGSSLKTALYGIVASHTARSYDQLWEDFKSTDLRSDGTIWDMYSSISSYKPGKPAQGASTGSEGVGYNREHSFPKSWFDDAKPMYTDLFHLYPTDVYVNNRRSNYPFGETNGETYKSSGGFSKVGSCTVSGYSGTVFEPADEYKGDFARTYFYMATAYEDKISSWSSPMLAGNKYPAYADWALTMLLRWAEEDPVSEKEIARNNAVYKIQKNRNPFIDFPGLEQYVWGSKTTTAFDPDNYTNSGETPTEKTVEAPVFSPAAGVVKEGTTVTITTATEGAYVYYTVNDGDLQAEYPPVELTINEATSITAYAMLGEQKSESVTANYTLQGEAPVGENIFQLLTANDQLKAGAQVIIVCQNKGTALAEQGEDIRKYAEVTVASDATVTTSTNASGLPYALLLNGKSGAWTLYDQVENVYLAHTAAKNKLNTATSATETSAQWTITVSSEGTALIKNNKNTDYSIQYNASAPRFACYKSSQQAVSIFALVVSDAIEDVLKGDAGNVSVYDLNGRLVRSTSTAAAALRNLPQGIYVVNGKKILVR